MSALINEHTQSYRMRNVSGMTSDMLAGPDLVAGVARS